MQVADMQVADMQDADMARRGKKQKESWGSPEKRLKGTPIRGINAQNGLHLR
jgi:hypothetical protein